jgi:MFS family permease
MCATAIDSFGNIGSSELVRWFGRSRLIQAVMVAGVATGFAWLLPMWAMLALLGLYYAAIMDDAAALMAGVISVSPGELRGITLGLYSMLGFVAALVSPTAFGLALDTGGGAHIGWAWSAAFCVLAAPNLISVVLLPLLTRPRSSLTVAVQVGAQA